MAESNKPLLMLSALDVMSKNVVMVPREMSLQGAARMLARAGVTGAPVVDGEGRCIGVLSTTDFMRSLQQEPSAERTNAPSDCMCSAWQIPEDAVDETCRVEHFMTKDPVLVTAGTKIGDLARMMMDAHIHRVIVVEGTSNRPIGIVSSMDILAAVARSAVEEKGHAAFEYPRAGGPHNPRLVRTGEARGRSESMSQGEGGRT